MYVRVCVRVMFIRITCRAKFLGGRERERERERERGRERESGREEREREREWERDYLQFPTDPLGVKLLAADENASSSSIKLRDRLPVLC